jgi:hypothetical protein
VEFGLKNASDVLVNMERELFTLISKDVEANTLV